VLQVFSYVLEGSERAIVRQICLDETDRIQALSLALTNSVSGAPGTRLSVQLYLPVSQHDAPAWPNLAQTASGLIRRYRRTYHHDSFSPVSASRRDLATLSGTLHVQRAVVHAIAA
jgi:hypothetical protein